MILCRARCIPEVLYLSSKLQTLSVTESSNFGKLRGSNMGSDSKVTIAIKSSVLCSIRGHKEGDFGKLNEIVNNFLGWFFHDFRTTLWARYSALSNTQLGVTGSLTDVYVSSLPSRIIPRTESQPGTEPGSWECCTSNTFVPCFENSNVRVNQYRHSTIYRNSIKAICLSSIPSGWSR